MADVREWLSGFHFSRGTRHLARDFSDAVLLAELLAQLVPAWVDLHNYPSANRMQHKLVNWETLNRARMHPSLRTDSVNCGGTNA